MACMNELEDELRKKVKSGSGLISRKYEDLISEGFEEKETNYVISI
jgi:hypothetical protein